MYDVITTMYKDKALSYVQTIKKAINEGDLKALKITAHSFKSMCFTVGNKQAGIIANEIETLAQQGNTEQLRDLCNRLRELTEQALEQTIGADERDI